MSNFSCSVFDVMFVVSILGFFVIFFLHVTHFPNFVENRVAEALHWRAQHYYFMAKQYSIDCQSIQD